MSDVNPWSFLFSLGEPEQRPVLLGAAGLAAGLAVARWAGPGDLQSALALAVLIGVPVLAFQMAGGMAQVFLLAGAIGSWLVFRAPVQHELSAVPVVLLSRLAYFAVPPLLLDLVLTEKGRDRLKLGLVHLYAPAAAAAAGVVIHLALRWGVGFVTGENEVRWAAAFYTVCYLVLLMVGLVTRLRPAAETPARQPEGAARAVELEEQGRFGMAARVYEREGQIEKGAEAAERAGDWARAGNLYHRAGNDFSAGEMYYRAQMWDRALDCYEQAQAFPAAARLCLQQGQLERAMQLYEKAGDPAGAVRAMEEAGQQPSGDLYRRAGLLPQAADAYDRGGDWQRAAEIYEHELQDLEQALALHLTNASFLHAGHLLESLGRPQEALEAYVAAPGGALSAARLYLTFGFPQKAAALLAQLPSEELDKLEDEETLTLVARVMAETGRGDDAIRILQGLKRRGGCGGVVHLLLGRAFLDRGLHDLAETELRTAASLPLPPSDEIQAAYLLGCVLEGAQQPEEALRIFHDILQKDLHYGDVEQRYLRLKTQAAGSGTGPGAPRAETAGGEIGK